MKMHKTSLMMAAALAGLLVANPLARAAETAAPADKPAAPATGQRGARGRDQLQALAQELKLTEDQKTQLKPLLEKQRTKQVEQARALRADTSLSTEQRREKLMALREQSRKDLAPEFKKILTSEQFEKWQKMPQGQRRGSPNGSRGGQGASAPKP
jgi:Spy/CpxP family protein refolding chaperone